MSENHGLSWMDEQRKSWRFRWWLRWFRFKDFLGYWLWTWPTDGLVWTFDIKGPAPECTCPSTTRPRGWVHSYTCAVVAWMGDPRPEDPRLMHARTKRLLAPDDPRHFEDLDDLG